MKKLILFIGLLLTGCSTTYHLSTLNHDPIYDTVLEVPANVQIDTLSSSQLRWKLRTDFRFRYDFAQYALSQPVSFDWNNIIKLAYRQPIKFKNLSKQPSSRRDFSLLINDSVNFNSIKKIAFKTDNSILKNVNLFDYYKGKEIPSGKKSYGVSFSFQDEKRTLTDKEIDSIMDKLFVNLQKELKAELR